MVCPNYWIARHSSKLDDVEQIFNHAERLLRRLPPPWERARRGRRPKFSSRRHAAVCLTAKCLDLTYREVEGSAPRFMRETIDHSTVGWAFKRLRKNYLGLLILLLRRELQRLLRCEFYTIDSTGISTSRLRRRRRAFKTVWMHESLKLHVLAGYSPQDSALVVFAASVTGESVHDATQFKPLLSDLWAKGEPLIADSAYDARSNIEFARSHGFVPVVKPRSYEPHGFVRRQAAQEFRLKRKLYRQRGIAEAIFAGLANRYDSKTRCKRLDTKISSILFMAVAHNLRTLMRVSAMRKNGISIFILIYSTNPVRGERLKQIKHRKQKRREEEYQGSGCQERPVNGNGSFQFGDICVWVFPGEK